MSNSANKYRKVYCIQDYNTLDEKKQVTKGNSYTLEVYMTGGIGTKLNVIRYRIDNSESIKNAIGLCTIHSSEVDKFFIDEVKYKLSLLLKVND